MLAKKGADPGKTRNAQGYLANVYFSVYLVISKRDTPVRVDELGR
jgi:hypothetical protein